MFLLLLLLKRNKIFQSYEIIEIIPQENVKIPLPILDIPELHRLSNPVDYFLITSPLTISFSFKLKQIGETLDENSSIFTNKFDSDKKNLFGLVFTPKKWQYQNLFELFVVHPLDNKKRISLINRNEINPDKLNHLMLSFYSDFILVCFNKQLKKYTSPNFYKDIFNQDFKVQIGVNNLTGQKGNIEIHDFCMFNQQFDEQQLFYLNLIYDKNLTACENDCSKFYRRKSNMLTILNCPKGLLFDNNKKLCNLPNRVNCKN
jgi:hypothetical protein